MQMQTRVRPQTYKNVWVDVWWFVVKQDSLGIIVDTVGLPAHQQLRDTVLELVAIYIYIYFLCSHHLHRINWSTMRSCTFVFKAKHCYVK